MHSLFLALLLLAQQPNELQALVNSATPTTGRRIGDRIDLQARDYILTDTLVIDTTVGMYLNGRTPFRTRIVWQGPSDRPVIWFRNANQCELKSLSIFIPPGYSASRALYITNEVGRRVNDFGCVSTANRFDDISVGDDNDGKYEDAVEIRSLVGDQNNELHIFRDFRILAGYTRSAFHIFGSQAHSMEFTNCYMTGKQANGSLAPHGVWCEYGGTFHWSLGSGGYHQCDFRLQNFQLVSSVRGWNSEGSSQYVVSTQSGVDVAPILVESCRLDGGNVAAGFVVRNNGIMILRGNQIVSKSTKCIVDQAALGSETAGQIITEGNAIYHTSGTYNAENPFVVADRSKVEVHHRGNVFRSYAEQHASRGDQLRTDQGMVLASKDTSGALSSAPQILSAEKTFANQWLSTAGLTIESYHNDGRMILKSKGSGAGIVFYHSNPIIEFLPGTDLRWPAGSIGHNTGLGVRNNAAYVSGTRQLRVDATHDWVDDFTMSYATHETPGRRMTSPNFEFWVNNQTYPPVPGTGVRVLKLDSSGLMLGLTKLQPLPDGDLEFVAPKGKVKLSRLIDLSLAN